MSEEPTVSEFAELGAHPSLVAALSEKGYEAPTPVQASVLGASDSDLLVSSQTGSGKTVAFGLVIARKLMGEAARITPSKMPRALVIAPTRELAAQVQRELAWLFAPTGAKVAAFTGGTDLRGDSRTIMRGVDIAVGTPGRLVDLLERRSLDLSGVEVLVLDEADEMLDMGFREAIEQILAAAPKERRTLLFSATLPSEIRALAKKYQRDAQSIDSRSAKTPGQSGHDDITYEAHLCKDAERTAALVNVLRMVEEERTLVFCRTREDVGELHRELASRGFLAAAISGDRAQAERDRALETMRQGRVRVLVATNVAARGLDLPELGLVVHSDLPENVEALTHRSGRTGRAGKKGRSLFLVSIGQRRKAERLFHAAKLKIVFTAAPSLDDVARHERDALKTEVQAALTEPPAEAAQTLARELLSDGDAEALVAALLDRALKARPAGEKLSAVDAGAMKAAPQGSVGAKSHGEPFVLFQVNLGAKDQAQVNWILPLICKRGAVTRREIGAIRIARDCTFVEVAERAAAEFAANAAERDPRAPNVQITRATATMPPRMFEGPSKHPARREGPPRPYAKPTGAAPRPYVKRDDAAPRPYVKRDDAAPRPYVKRDDAAPRPYVKRDDAAPRSYDKKPARPAERDARPSYVDRPAGDRPRPAVRPTYTPKPSDRPAPRKPPR